MSPNRLSKPRKGRLKCLLILNALMYEILSIRENNHVLEIGFGTGPLIKKIAEHLDNELVEGIDFSKPMVAIAQKKNRSHINKIKVKIHLGDFDVALSPGDINTNLRSIGELTNLGSLVLLMRALEERWISS
jgi:tRNA G46 methylase TrmB